MFLANAVGPDHFRAQLALVRDLERTIGRLSSGTGNGRDLMALRMALEQIPWLKQNLNDVLRTRPAASLIADEIQESPDAAPPLLAELTAQIVEMPDLVELIGRAIVEEPPLAVKEGGIIRDGFDGALDELRQATSGGKDWIAKLQQDEIARTGIASLKVRFNSGFRILHRSDSIEPWT